LPAIQEKDNALDEYQENRNGGLPGETVRDAAKQYVENTTTEQQENEGVYEFDKE
jgi:hypothetical protein